MKHHHKKILLLSALIAPVLCLSACGEHTKKELGLIRTAPDEFAVLKRAPLEMPPDYTLPPPQPGAPRPQEAAPEKEAEKVVFGGEALTNKRTPDSAEAALLRQAGADNVDPAIRQTVDKETGVLAPRQKPVAEKLLGIVVKNDKPVASVVDAKAEAERLKKNAEEGKPVTEGETPSIEK